MSDASSDRLLPASFEDVSGRKWSLRLTYTAYGRCKEFGFDASSDDWSTTIADDPVMLGMAIYELCRDEATSKGFDDWGRFADEVLANGDVAGQAIDALAGAVINFTHPSRRGLRAKQWALRKAAESRWEAAGGDPKIDQLIEASIEAVDKKVQAILEDAKQKIEAG